MVSRRVVNTVTSSSVPAMGKTTSAPRERPIQFRCCSLIDSSHKRSFESRSYKRRSAYRVIRSTHWRRGFFSTWLPQRSHFPCSRSSLESPVLHVGHQLIGSLDSYAKPALNI